MMTIRTHIIFFTVFLLLFKASGPVHAQNRQTDPVEGFVYFADSSRTALKSVKKRFAAGLDTHQFGLEILKTLTAGPQGQEFKAVWPQKMRVRAFFVSDDQKAYVDLDVEKEDLQNMDVQSELLAVYALVNSLTVNIPKIRMVKILIKGEPVQSLAGHVDLEPFYETNMLIVK